jgi:hypothetical protein
MHTQVRWQLTYCQSTNAERCYCGEMQIQRQTMKTWRLLLVVFSLLTLNAAAEFEVLIAPTPDTTEKQFIWRVEPGHWYRLERSVNLATTNWVPQLEFQAEGPVFVHDKGGGPRGFYRLARIDKCPPQIQSYYPYDGAFSVARHSAVRINLTDMTGIDASSIQLTVGALGTFTPSDPELDFAVSNLTFNAQGTPLGPFGAKIPLMLQVADVLGHTLVHNWSVELEHPDIPVINLFVFGSPEAVAMGQELTETQLRFGQTSGHPYPANPPPPTWRISGIETNRIIIQVDDQNVMLALLDQLPPGTSVANAAVGRIEEMFHRRIVAVATAPQLLVLETEDVPLENLFTSYSYSVDEDTAIRLQTDEDGNLLFPPANIAMAVTLKLADFDKRINLISKHWDWSDKEYFTENPHVSLTFDRLDLTLNVYADVAGKFVLSTDDDKRAMEFSAALTTEFDAGVLPVLALNIGTRHDAEGDILKRVNLVALVVWIGPVPLNIDFNFGVGWKAYVEGQINATVKGGLTYNQTTTYWADYDYYRSTRFKSGREVSGPGLEQVPITATATGTLGAGLSVIPYLELAVGPRITVLGAEASAQAGVRGYLTAYADMEVEANVVVASATVGGTPSTTAGRDLKACLTAGLDWGIDAFYRLELDAPWPFNALDMTKKGEKTLVSGQLITPFTKCWYIYTLEEPALGSITDYLSSLDLAPYSPSSASALTAIGQPKKSSFKVGSATVIPQVVVTNSSGTVVAEVDGGYTRQWYWNDIPIPGMTSDTLGLESPISGCGGTYQTIVSGSAGMVLASPLVQVTALPSGAPLESALGATAAEILTTGELDAEPFGAIGPWKGTEVVFLPLANGEVEIYDRAGEFIEALATGFSDLGPIDTGTIGGSNRLALVGRFLGGDMLQIYDADGALLDTYPRPGANRRDGSHGGLLGAGHHSWRRAKRNFNVPRG